MKKEKETHQHVCPVESAGGLDNRFRRWLQNPQKVLKPYIKKGMTVLDLGCGPGFFTIEIAKMLEGSGKVIAADLQKGMLNKVERKIIGTAFMQHIVLHKCEKDKIGLSWSVDFVLAFYMVHEVPDQETLFRELKAILNPQGQMLIIEPNFHVNKKAFEEMISTLEKAGFEIVARPKFFLSRAVLVSKSR
jgi:ubiquinone/menaquinone biosynthesis C-methylase UbiE